MAPLGHSALRVVPGLYPEALLAFETLPSELPLVFVCFSLLDHNGVGVAHGEVEEGQLLSLFSRVDLDVIGALPLAFICSALEGALYSKRCCVIGRSWRGCLRWWWRVHGDCWASFFLFVVFPVASVVRGSSR